MAYGSFRTVPYGVAKRQTKPEATPETRLSRSDWIVAAIDSIEHGGVAAIAVEPLAAKLGATKGSFYWHFSTRDELVTAAMQWWEEHATEAVIANVATVLDPMDRIRQLFGVVFGYGREERIEARIVLTSFDPRVSASVERVTAMRIEFLESLFRGLGFSRSVAAKRARIAYAAYLGHLRLLLDIPAETEDESKKKSSAAATRAYAEELLQVLTSPAGSPAASP